MKELIPRYVLTGVNASCQYYLPVASDPQARVENWSTLCHARLAVPGKYSRSVGKTSWRFWWIVLVEYRGIRSIKTNVRWTSWGSVILHLGFDWSDWLYYSATPAQLVAAAASQSEEGLLPTCLFTSNQALESFPICVLYGGLWLACELIAFRIWEGSCHIWKSYLWATHYSQVNSVSHYVLKNNHTKMKQNF